MDVIRLAFGMKKGVFLGEDETRCQTFLVSEFKITPTEARSPFNIDGDPHAVGAVLFEGCVLRGLIGFGFVA